MVPLQRSDDETLTKCATIQTIPNSYAQTLMHYANNTVRSISRNFLENDACPSSFGRRQTDPWISELSEFEIRVGNRRTSKVRQPLDE